MIGAIAGDVVGSTCEFHYTKSIDFDLFTPGSTFTDDTMMTVAVADCAAWAWAKSSSYVLHEGRECLLPLDSYQGAAVIHHPHGVGK
jgi:hypothetical protein